MENRIIERKLNFILHLQNLDENALAKEVYNEQLKHEWPGLTKEAKYLCQEMNLPDITKERHVKMKRKKLKSEIKEAVEKKNERDLRKNIERYAKIEDLIKENYEV